MPALPSSSALAVPEAREIGSSASPLCYSAQLSQGGVAVNPESATRPPCRWHSPPAQRSRFRPVHLGLHAAAARPGPVVRRGRGSREWARGAVREADAGAGMDADSGAAGGGGALPPAVAKLEALQAKAGQRLQAALDASTPHIAGRWAGWGALVLLYLLRVTLLRGFYIVTYGLGIYNLNLVLGFLSPQIDPETEGPELPTKSDQEFKPFVRRLPEFKFWCAAPHFYLIAISKPVFISLTTERGADLTSPSPSRQVVLPEVLPDWAGHDAVPRVRRARLLAHPAALLHRAAVHHDEAPDQAHDQVQVRAVVRGQEGGPPPPPSSYPFCSPSPAFAFRPRMA